MEKEPTLTYSDLVTSRIAGAKDDGVEFEYQEVGKEMSKYYPKKEHNWMWSLFWKHSLADIKLAHEKTVAQGVKSVRYLNGVLRAPYKPREDGKK